MLTKHAIANVGWRVNFNFSAKIGVKSAKNEVFSIICMPMVGATAPPMATLLPSAIF